MSVEEEEEKKDLLRDTSVHTIRGWPHHHFLPTAPPTQGGGGLVGLGWASPRWRVLGHGHIPCLTPGLKSISKAKQILDTPPGPR